MSDLGQGKETDGESQQPLRMDSYDPFNEPQLTNPYALFLKWRESQPVFYSKLINHWIVSRYQDVDGVLKNHEICSARNTLTPIFSPCPAARDALHSGGWALCPALGNNDEPDHSRFRRLVQKTFMPVYIKSMEPRIHDLVDAGISRLQERAQANLMTDLIVDLPARVILSMLGFDAAAASQLIAGGRNRILFIWGQPTAEEQVSLAKGVAELFRFCREIILERRLCPREDFTTKLIEHAQQDESAFSDDELASVLFAMFTAGHETTSSLMGNVVYQLLSHRASWCALCDDSRLIGGAIEEVLRFDSSVIAWRRYATRDSIVGDQTIHAGSQLLLLLGSANRDEVVFADAEHFDIGRKNAAKHLSFGRGVHSCLGNVLAKTETRILIQALSTRFPRMRLSEGYVPTYLPSVAFHGVRDVNVTLY